MTNYVIKAILLAGQERRDRWSANNLLDTLEGAILWHVKLR